MPIHRTTNPYFNKFKNFPEQSLLQDLVSESISINGIDVYYLPKTEIAFDNIFHEGQYSSFSEYAQLPIYIESADGFEGQGDFLQKFGIEIEDQLEVSVSVTSFNNLFSNRTKPLEGDLIYIPIIAKMFQIHFSEDEKNFYQHGGIYYYTMTLKLFTFSNEQFNTGIPEIDDIQNTESYLIELELGAGSGIFILDESILQTNSNAIGYVAAYNAVSSTLTTKNNVGTFETNDTVTGLQSGASYLVTNVNDQSTDFNYGDNEEFESNTVTIIDDTEDNPFGDF